MSGPQAYYRSNRAILDGLHFFCFYPLKAKCWPLYR